MDVYCKKCGEPWDLTEILDGLNGRNDGLTKKEAEKILRGEGCPSCGFGKYCPLCKGTGKCYVCNGTGIETFRDWITGKELERICIECNGTEKCTRCNGTGQLTKNHDEEYYSSLINIDGEIDILDYI